MKVTGSCHCKAITYEAEVDPATARICHCTDCQTLSGTAFRVNIPTKPETFRLLSGRPRVYVKTAESGNQREQAFCENCGSALYAATPGPEPRVYSLRAGTIDQRQELLPVRQIWTRSRLRWLGELESIASAAKQG